MERKIKLKQTTYQKVLNELFDTDITIKVLNKYKLTPYDYWEACAVLYDMKANNHGITMCDNVANYFKRKGAIVYLDDDNINYHISFKEGIVLNNVYKKI